MIKFQLSSEGENFDEQTGEETRGQGESWSLQAAQEATPITSRSHTPSAPKARGRGKGRGKAALSHSERR